MKQKYAFTTTAMAAALESTNVSYEDLAEIEKDFEDVETEIIKKQAQLMAPLYHKRQKTVSQIQDFWPLVIEQAPPDIDQYIQPSDSALLLTSLKSLSVSRFEIESSSTDETPDSTTGDPRSVAIRFEFNKNEYFEDSVLEKKFWQRKAKDGWTGLVSEPVPIKWKQGKDLTGGLLDMVVKAWEIEKKQSQPNGGNAEEMKAELSKQQKSLKKKIDSTGMGGLSFFAWFGFIGRKVSAEESKDAAIRDEEKRIARKAATKEGDGDDDSETAADSDDEEDANEDLDMDLEIFENGDDLAVAISEDLWPNAIKYFTQAQEQDALSDADFESDDEQLMKNAANDQSDDDDDDEGRPAKKRKN